MKNSIQIIAVALVSFSNVVASSGLIKNNDFKNDSKNVEIKTVSYVDSRLLTSEMEGLSLSSKTILEVIEADSKVIENTTFFANTYVNYANEDLFETEIQMEQIQKSIEFQIENDLKVTESKVEVLEKVNFVNYADENLIHLELGFLKNTKLSIDEVVKSNLALIEGQIANTLKVKALKRNIKISKSIRN